MPRIKQALSRQQQHQAQFGLNPALRMHAVAVSRALVNGCVDDLLLAQCCDVPSASRRCRKVPWRQIR